MTVAQLTADRLPIPSHFRPVPPLSELVDVIWYINGIADYQREKVLPNGVIEIIINLGSPHKVIDKSNHERSTLYKESWVAGIQGGFLLIESVAESHLLGVRFKPGGAYPLFRFPMTELRNDVIELDLILKAEIARLREMVLEACSLQERFAIVERWLLAKAHFDTAAGSLVRGALQAINGAEFLSIGSLAESLGVSHKHLDAEFNKQVGLPPKSLARILRFRAVIRAVKDAVAVDWTEIAHRFHYYDQSHFIHDFREMTGTTPSDYLRTRALDPDHIAMR